MSVATLENKFTSENHASEIAITAGNDMSQGMARQGGGSTAPSGMNYIEPLDQWMPAEDMPIFNFQLMDTFDWLRDNEGSAL